MAKASKVDVLGMELPIRERSTIHRESAKLIPEVDPDFLLREEMLQLAYAVATDSTVLLTGPASGGKTIMVEQLAAMTGNPLHVAPMHGEVSPAEMVGRHKIENGSMRWVNGIITNALERGDWLLLDDAQFVPPEYLAVLHSLTDHRRYMVLLEDDARVVRDETGNFRLFMACNPPDDPLYMAGAKRRNQATFSRLGMTIEVDYLDPVSEIALLERKGPSVKKKVIEGLVVAANLVRADVKAGKESLVMGTRSLVSMVEKIDAGMPTDMAFRVCLVNQLPSKDREYLTSVFVGKVEGIDG